MRGGSRAPKTRASLRTGSWNHYDHYFSGAAFPSALPVVFARRPRRLLDVGGNRGDWAIRCARHDPDVQVTILDLPGQTAPALRAAGEAGLGGRIDAQAYDLRDQGRPFPSGYDAVWMSQFLDCFSEEDALGLLRRGTAALAPGGTLYVLEPCWDRQPNEIGAYCLRAASLYFVCMASGRSGFHPEDLRRLAVSAGLEIEEERDGLGLGHTLFVCRRGRPA